MVRSSLELRVKLCILPGLYLDPTNKERGELLGLKVKLCSCLCLTFTLLKKGRDLTKEGKQYLRLRVKLSSALTLISLTTGRDITYWIQGYIMLLLLLDLGLNK